MNISKMIQHDLSKIYTFRKISPQQPLKYLIAIPCVNREERNAIQIIHQTFDCFEKNGIFQDYENISVDIILFESGSKDIRYLEFLKPYFEKYPQKIHIIFSKTPLDGPQNIYRLFQHVQQQDCIQKYDFILWMDDDIIICKNFILNCDAWIRSYMNFTIFGSLYSPYHSYTIPQSTNPFCERSYIRSYHGSCCTIFKPILAKYITPLWFQTKLLRNVVEPDLRFRESIMKFFPHIQYFFVSNPSFVQHLNIGSAIYQNKHIKKGHHARQFIGENIDPLLYQTLSPPKITRNVECHIQPKEKSEETISDPIWNETYQRFEID